MENNVEIKPMGSEPPIDFKEVSDSPKRIERIQNLIGHLAEKATTSKKERPYYNFLSGDRVVENQQIQLYFEHDLNRLTFRFKIIDYTSKLPIIIEKVKEILAKKELTPSYLEYSKINSQDKIKELLSQDMDYEDLDRELTFYKICSGMVYQFNYDDASVSFDTSEPVEYNQYSKMGDSRTTSGMVSISYNLPTELKEVKELILKFENTCSLFFDVKEVLALPKPESTEEYKKNRLNWLLNVSEEPTSEELSKMRLTSYSNGYKTYVYEGFKELLESRFGKFCFIHDLNFNEDNLMNNTNNSHEILISIFKKGLICSSERYKTGDFSTGMSSLTDIHSGGGDYIFTRLVTKSTFIEDLTKLSLIISPKVADRTDWFSYNKDMYGSTDPYFFQDRLSPFGIFEYEMDTRRHQNEVMFRNSLSPRSILALSCDSEKTKNLIINILKNNNITEINGLPLEDFIVVSRRDYIYNLCKDTVYN